jgi:hypothetical protein
MSRAISDPNELSRRAKEEVLDRVLRKGAPAVNVPSPPGAGKTDFVENVVAVGAQHARLRIGVVVPQNEQAFDLLRRLAANYRPMGVQPLLSQSRELPPDIIRSELLRPAFRVSDLDRRHRVVVGTVAKFASSSLDFIRKPFDLIVCDEAYQVAFKDFAPLSMIASQFLFVGDPGQLFPLVKVDTARFEAAPVKVHWPAPQELMRRFDDVAVVQLPVTRRLPQDTVNLIQPSHYPNMPFVSAAVPSQRRIQFDAAGLLDPVDRALNILEKGATIVGVLLPARDYPVDDVDEEIAATMGRVVRRLLDRRVRMGGRQLRPQNIGCADAHVASNAAVARNIRTLGLSTEEVVSETPEQWQGLQRAIMVVKHPLSGKQRLDAFSLDPGRWCVMLSRHLGACIIVGRAGIGDALRRHQHNCADRPMQSMDFEWSGWNAHSTLWFQLEQQGRLVYA